MPVYIRIITSFFISLFFSLFSVRIVVGVIAKLNLCDKPGIRSSSEKPATPTLGGIAIFFSFILASTIGLFGYEFPEWTFIILATMVIFFIGLKDDLLTLPPHMKINGQIIVSVIIIFFAKIRFTNLQGLFGLGEIGMISSVLITIFTIIVIINAFNLMDGIDGLAAGLTMMAALIFGGWFLISNHIDYAIISFSLVGTLAGFFFYNVYGKRNKILLGETGTQLLGTIIAILLIKFNECNIDQTQPYAVPSVPIISFGIIFYPLFDTFRVLLLRIANPRTSSGTNKNHLHHRLHTAGFSHQKITYTILGFNLMIAVFIFLIQRLGILRLTPHPTALGAAFSWFLH